MDTTIVHIQPLTHHSNCFVYNISTITTLTSTIEHEYIMDSIEQYVSYFLIVNLLLWQFSMNFNTVVDALYAVYEASTLELWSFMMYTAIDGNNVFSAGIFYFLLVLFIVILLQVRAKPHPLS